MRAIASDITLALDDTEIEASAEFHYQRAKGGEPASVEITRITDGTRDFNLAANQLRAIEASLLRDMQNAA